jgi:hypothetical protein
MSNFKSGSGDLDFGGDDAADGTDAADETDDSTARQNAADETDDAADGTDETGGGTPDAATGKSASTPPGSVAADRDAAAARSTSGSESSGASPPTGRSADQYPYFVRRSNVGDERDKRLEIHVRDKVADREAEFRADLAERLDAPEISKTDAREFALLAAFTHPDRVAELMRDEGFGALD